jgi:hypothetical protein
VVMRISSIEDADRLARMYFEFHDCMIKSWSIVLKDELRDGKPDFGNTRADDSIMHLITGEFEVTCQFVCARYDHDCSSVKNIDATFRGVDEMCIDFRVPEGSFVHWTLNSFRIVPAYDHAGALLKGRLWAELEYSACMDGKCWSPLVRRMFRFKNAEFGE